MSYSIFDLLQGEIDVKVANTTTTTGPVTTTTNRTQVNSGFDFGRFDVVVCFFRLFTLQHESEMSPVLIFILSQHHSFLNMYICLIKNEDLLHRGIVLGLFFSFYRNTVWLNIPFLVNLLLHIFLK